ncbi:MAG: geranylgeranylglycerol-phosphate geranylgeranyltransferase [Runella sp.]
MKPSPRLQDFALGIFRLVRWPNLLMIAISQYMARIFLIGPRVDWYFILQENDLFLISLSTVLIAAAGYVINDYFDIKIDLINKPRRVIIGRYLKRRWAITLHQILNVVGCLVALWVSKWVFVLSVVCATLLWFYASYFKKRPFIGNVIVALLTAFSLIILSVYYEKGRLLVLIYALFVFTISLVREIIKDIEDLRGDVSHGCRTLPIVWGVRATKKVIYALIAVFIPTLFVVAQWLQNTHLAWVFMALTLLIGWLVYRLVYADTKKEFGVLSSLCKLIMLLGMLSMIWV